MSSSYTVLINGGTSEVGRQIAQKFVEGGHKVIISSDNSEQCFEVQKEIFDETGERIDIIITDFSSQQEIKEMVEEIENKYPDLNIIINNLSITSSEQIMSEDDIELVFHVNYLSRFLLTNLLIPTLNQNKPARIINVVCETPQTAKINFGNIDLDEEYDDDDAEVQANLADIMYIQSLSERLVNTHVTANSINPGKLTGEMHERHLIRKPVEMLFKKLFHKLDIWTSVSPEKAGELVYGISMNEAQKNSGKYFVQNKPAKLPEFAAKKSNRDKLWELSNELTESTFDTF